jgi:hypothetical protein
VVGCGLNQPHANEGSRRVFGDGDGIFVMMSPFVFDVEALSCAQIFFRQAANTSKRRRGVQQMIPCNKSRKCDLFGFPELV